jgi:hypothetical protein
MHDPIKKSNHEGRAQARKNGSKKLQSSQK